MEITQKLLEKTLKYSSIFYKVVDGSQEGEYYAYGDGDYIISLAKFPDGKDYLCISLISDYSDFTEEELEDVINELEGEIDSVCVGYKGTDVVFTMGIPCEIIENLRQCIDNATQDLLDIDLEFYDFATGDVDEDMLPDDDYEDVYADDDFDEMMTMDDIFDAMEQDVLDDLEYYEKTKTNNIGLLDVICSSFSWSDGDDELIDELTPYWEEYIKNRAEAQTQEKREEVASWFCHQCSREIYYAEEDLWNEVEDDIDEDLLLEIFARLNPILDKEKEYFNSTGKVDPDFAKKVCAEFEIEDEEAMEEMQEGYLAYNSFREEETDPDVLSYHDDTFTMDLGCHIYDCLAFGEEDEEDEEE